MDVENFAAHLQMFEELSKRFTVKMPDGQSPPGEGRSVFMDAYAMGARWHMSTFGSTQRQLAVICFPRTTCTGH